MLNLQEKVLIELQEVFRTKSFSPVAKREIKETLLEASKLDINKEDNGKKLFSIIDKLKKIDTFKVNTRKQLMKIKSIRDELDPTADGYVFLPDKIVVVVKSTQTQTTIYHELIHITQTDESYYVPEKYGYSNTLKAAMKEGEAIAYEIELLKRKFPKTYMQISSLSTLYQVFYEFYQDMEKLLGVELLDKWKNDDILEDFISVANSHTMNGYGINFYAIYAVWSELLYRMVLKSKDEDFLKLVKLDSESNELEFNISEYQEKCSDEIAFNNHINKCKTHINEVDNKLKSKQLLKEEFGNTLNTLKKELNDYISENGMDDFVLEQQRSIDNLTIDDYVKSLVDQKNEYCKAIDNSKKLLGEVLDKKKNLQWVESFLLPVKELSNLELVNVKELGMGYLSKYGKNLNERFNITKRLVKLDEFENENVVVNSHSK